MRYRVHEFVGRVSGDSWFAVEVQGEPDHPGYPIWEQVTAFPSLEQADEYIANKQKPNEEGWMKLSLSIRIDSDNAAVVDDPVEEMAQAAERVASRLRAGDMTGGVMDTNGNTVGWFEAKRGGK